MGAKVSESNKFVAFLAIVATPFALGAFLLTWSPAAQYSSEDPAGDGYVPPRSIQALVDRTQESTVTIWCEPKLGKGSQGTAWAIELDTDVSEEYPTALITNHHVITDCTQNTSVTLILSDKSRQQGSVYTWDESTD